jgi:hypothetical protein
MKCEKFKAWRPTEDVPRRLTVIGLKDEDEGLEIYLRPGVADKRTLRIRFRDVIAYRCIDESFRMETWTAIEAPGSLNLLEIANSHWIAWLEKESGGVLEEFDLTHYAIFTDDDCIDVVVRSPPEATWILP